MSFTLVIRPRQLLLVGTAVVFIEQRETQISPVGCLFKKNIYFRRQIVDDRFTVTYCCCIGTKKHEVHFFSDSYQTTVIDCF